MDSSRRQSPIVIDVPHEALRLFTEDPERRYRVRKLFGVPRKLFVVMTLTSLLISVVCYAFVLIAFSTENESDQRHRMRHHSDVVFIDETEFAFPAQPKPLHPLENIRKFAALVMSQNATGSFLNNLPPGQNMDQMFVSKFRPSPHHLAKQIISHIAQSKEPPGLELASNNAGSVLDNVGGGKRQRYSTKVNVTVEIERLNAITEAKMEFSITARLTQSWIDERLKVDLGSLANADEFKRFIKLETGSWSKIWTPDIFLRNEKRSAFHNVTQPNRVMLLRVSDGKVVYKMKLTLVLSCPMNLWKYPLDKQICPIKLESFGHTKDTLELFWKNGTRGNLKYEDMIALDHQSALPHYTVTDIQYGDCSKRYVTGAYPCLQIDVHLARNYFFHLVKLYLPSTLMVCVSWISFWVDQQATQARVSLGLLTVLTLTSIKDGASDSLPPVGYVKAIDVWLSSCLMFVSASLIQYALVHVLARQDTVVLLMMFQRWNKKLERIMRTGSTMAPTKSNTNLEIGLLTSPVAPMNEMSTIWDTQATVETDQSAAEEARPSPTKQRYSRGTAARHHGPSGKIQKLAKHCRQWSRRWQRQPDSRSAQKFSQRRTRDALRLAVATNNAHRRRARDRDSDGGVRLSQRLVEEIEEEKNFLFSMSDSDLQKYGLTKQQKKALEKSRAVALHFDYILENNVFLRAAMTAAKLQFLNQKSGIPQNKTNTNRMTEPASPCSTSSMQFGSHPRIGSRRGSSSITHRNLLPFKTMLLTNRGGGANVSLDTANFSPQRQHSFRENKIFGRKSRRRNFSSSSGGAAESMETSLMSPQTLPLVSPPPPQATSSTESYISGSSILTFDEFREIITGAVEYQIEHEKQWTSNVDETSRVFFPMSFVLFNIVYWSSYAFVFT